MENGVELRLISTSWSPELPIWAVIDQTKAHSFRQWLKAKNFEDSQQSNCKIVPNSVALSVNNNFVSRVLQETAVNGIYVVDDFNFSLQNLKLPPKVKKTSNGIKLLITTLQTLQHPTFQWSETFSKDLPTSWEKHGDLLMLPENCFMLKEWESLGTDLWTLVASAVGCSRVAKRGRITNNDFRSPAVTLLLGSSSWVEHVDNKIRYQYDVTKCMFSSGNITEKLRISHFNCHGETIVDLFAGIGYFVLPYLVHAKASLVYACEWNPHAVEALKKNLLLNGVAEKCIVLEGDNRQTCPQRVADQVNLGLIPSSEEFLDVACAALKLGGGILHVHGNVTSGRHGIKHVVSTMLHKEDYEQMALGNCDVSNKKSDLLPCLPSQTINSNLNQVTPKNNDKNFITNDQMACASSVVSETDQKSTQNYCGKQTTVKVAPAKTKSEWTEWACKLCRKLEQILHEQTSKDWLSTVLHIEHVKSYAPHIDHLVADIRCLPKTKETE